MSKQINGVSLSKQSEKRSRCIHDDVDVVHTDDAVVDDIDDDDEDDDDDDDVDDDDINDDVCNVTAMMAA